LLSGEFTKAIELTNLAIQVNDSIGAEQVLSACYKVMGMALQQQNRLDSAEYYFNQVLAISNKLRDQSQKSATVAAYIHLAELYALKKKPQLQLQKLEEAAQFAKQHHLEESIEQIYNSLILFHAKANHQQEVIKYIQEYKEIADSLNAQQLADRIELTNSTIKGHELAKEKKVLELESEKQFKELKLRNFIIVSFVIAAMLLLWLIYKLVNANRQFNIVNHQLVEQAKYIEQQNKILEELNATKDKFFSIVAHDLKSPLNSLRTFSKMLVTDIHVLDKEDIVTIGAELNKSVDNTLILADNIITWARVQMKEQEWHAELIPVQDITDNICQVYSAVAEKKEINFICQVDKTLKVFGDKDQLTFIIRNLINNAVKFTASGSWVRLTVNALPNGFVEFEVADGGIGIPPEVRKNLFKLDKKKGARGTAGEKGTGLGLILCYDFLKLNNGKLEVDSEVDKGSVFKVAFPSNEKIS
jgi:signal transduction histidine kinase